MRITEYLTGRVTALSFEFFPPRTPEQEQGLYDALAELIAFSPDFVSVTYGAMGKTRGKTFYWANEIKEKFGIEPVAHLTCVAASRKDIDEQLAYLTKIRVENILALRGDLPEGESDFVPPPDRFKYAGELIAHIKQIKPYFCIGAAGYPEKHPEARSFDEDIQHLKEKIEAGAEFIITQLFFDNRHFFNFMSRCRSAGIYTPVIPGIMPITSYKQIKHMTKVCGATIPEELLKKMEKHADDKDAIEAIGVEQAIMQCKELVAAGVPGLHFFIMNQAGPISRILKELRK